MAENYCSKCGKGNPVGAHYCSACGNSLRPVSEEVKVPEFNQSMGSGEQRTQVPWYNSTWFGVVLIVGVVVFFIADPQSIPRCWPVALVPIVKWINDIIQKH